MEPYRDFKLLSTNELQVVRHGFFNPVFDLSDGEFVYGKVITNKTSKDFPVLETATESWVPKREGAFKGTFLLNNSRGENIGSVTDGGRLLKLHNGFEANLSITGGGQSTVSGGWENSEFGELMHFKQSWYSYKKPYVITLDTGLLKRVPEIPLLILLGTHLSFLKQTRSLR
jgi:hypothetical protein